MRSGSGSLLLRALRNEGAVRLMKDDFIDDHPLAAKFDDEALQLGDANLLPFSGTVDRLVVRLQRLRSLSRVTRCTIAPHARAIATPYGLDVLRARNIQSNGRQDRRTRSRMTELGHRGT
jgi:hypothetical protein